MTCRQRDPAVLLRFAHQLWAIEVDDQECALLATIANSAHQMVGGTSTGDALARVARLLAGKGLVRYLNSRDGGWPAGMWAAYPTCSGRNAMWRHAGDTHVDGCGARWNPDGRCSGCRTARLLDLPAYAAYLVALPAAVRTKQLSTAALWCDEHGYLRSADTTTHKMCRFAGSPIHDGMVSRVCQPRLSVSPHDTSV